MAADIQQIAAARKSLAGAIANRDALLQQRAATGLTFAQAARTLSPDDPHLARLAEAARQADDAWQRSHGVVRDRQSELAGLVGEFLGQEGDSDFSSLDTRYPIVLLPVRIETRVESGGQDLPSVLKIRIYPDEILADAHEPSLTQQEVDAGRAYWNKSWTSGETLSAWQGLLAAFSPQRAAWIVLETRPDNLQDAPAGAPNFPDPNLRPGVWTRGVEARALPDRWIAQAYRGGQLIHQAVSGPIVEPLVLTLNPNADPADKVDPYGDGFTVARELQWTIDFDAAAAVGMGIVMPLDRTDVVEGIDRLLVFGVKPSATPEDNETRLSELIDNHHYARGMAFVPQGTRTNNTTDQPSGYPPPDPNGAISFAVERTNLPPAADADGPRFMRALGVNPDLSARLANAGMHEQAGAQAMNQALFPVTMGYFLEQMLRPQFGDSVVDAARDFFLNSLRARGPLPAFRIGSVPYGVLPVTSLAGWGPDPNATPAERELPDLLRRLLPNWLNAVSQAPHVGATNDPDGDMARILAMEASAREVWVRSFAGKTFIANMLVLLGIDPQAVYSVTQTLFAINVLASLGHPEWIFRVMDLMNLKDATEFRYSLVTDQPLSETDPLPAAGNYLAQLASATSVDQILAGYSDTEPTALLYQLLRHATLRECYRVVFDTLVDYNMATPDQRIEPEVHGVAPPAGVRPNLWQHLATKIPAISATRFIGDVALSGPAGFNLEMASYQGALRLLQGLPTAELQRLLTETLDICSHRIDAWITALPSGRLDRMREVQPTGLHLGAYAWVESLQARFLARAKAVKLPDGRQVFLQKDNGGYIHAPTMTHAAAAAVLRNAYLSQAGDNPQRYEINLSSARVRQAAFILDSVREGQPTGAVLGYMFEGTLHDQQLDMFIADLRGRFPLQVNPTRDAGVPNEAVAARDVVDGLQLRNAFVAGTIEFGALAPAPTPAQLGQLQAALRLLDEVFDSLADLVLSEAVYQLVQSKTAAGGAALDTAAGAPAADPAVIEQPRGGRSVTHRVALLLGTAGAPPAANPRARAEPYLNAWAGGLLGDLTRVLCKVFFQGGPGTRMVAMSELGFEPLDILSLSRTLAKGVMSSDQHGSELDRRVRDFVLSVQPGATGIAITFDIVPVAAGQRSFPQLLELARAVADVVGAARALRAEDLMLPQEVPSDPIPPPPDDGRITAAISALETAATNLKNAVTPAAKRAALRAASLYGIEESYPFSDDTLLGTQAARVAAEMDRRIAAATAPGLAPGAIAATIFGAEFRFMTPFQLPAGPAAELDLALAQGPSLVDSPKDVQRWLQRVARVRAAMDSWRRLGLYTVAAGQPRTQFELAQLPFRNNTRWAALPYAGDPLPAGLFSFELHRPVIPGAGQPWAGLLLDDWTEVIPNRTETTGVSFHFDNPRAETGQAVLIAVPPDNRERWDIQTFANTLNETIDLAKVRAVDLELLPTLGQLLPAIYLATDVEDNTISTNFSMKTRLRPQIQRIATLPTP
jgi:hypothetical protein